MSGKCHKRTFTPLKTEAEQPYFASYFTAGLCLRRPAIALFLGLATIQGGVKILLNIEKIFLEDETLSLPL